MKTVLDAAKDIRALWLRKPVANDAEWHAAVLALIRALDAQPTKHMDAAALEAHKRKAEDTPA